MEVTAESDGRRVEWGSCAVSCSTVCLLRNEKDLKANVHTQWQVRMPKRNMYFPSSLLLCIHLSQRKLSVTVKPLHFLVYSLNSICFLFPSSF